MAEPYDIHRKLNPVLPDDNYFGSPFPAANFSRARSKREKNQKRLVKTGEIEDCQ
jgi:hypothetical protein